MKVYQVWNCYGSEDRICCATMEIATKVAAELSYLDSRDHCQYKDDSPPELICQLYDLLQKGEYQKVVTLYDEDYGTDRIVIGEYEVLTDYKLDVPAPDEEFEDDDDEDETEEN